MIIHAEGLLEGERLRACSPPARLWWPYIFLLSNGYGRFELDVRRMAARFWSFPEPPAAEDIERYCGEYEKNHLLFVYVDGAKRWGQWDTALSNLPDYRRAADRRSPEPPAAEYEAWLREYHGEAWEQYDCREAALQDQKRRDRSKRRRQSQTKGAPEIAREVTEPPAKIPETQPTFGKIPETSAEASGKFPFGIGIGIGTGNGNKTRESLRPPTLPVPGDLETLVERVGHEHPANAHLTGLQLPRDQQEAIAEAIARDGYELVMAGTLKLRDAVARWPEHEKRMRPNPVRFYRDAEYRKDPIEWEKPHANPVSANPSARGGAVIQRAHNNLLAAQQAIQMRRERKPDAATGGTAGPG